jgi:hypothetical protein
MGMEVTKSAIVNVSADRLWSILGDDFDKVGALVCVRGDGIEDPQLRA